MVFNYMVNNNARFRELIMQEIMKTNNKRNYFKEIFKRTDYFYNYVKNYLLGNGNNFNETFKPTLKNDTPSQQSNSPET